MSSSFLLLRRPWLLRRALPPSAMPRCCSSSSIGHLLLLPSSSSHGGGGASRDGVRPPTDSSIRSLIAAGAISISFAASTYSSVAAAKEIPRADLIPKDVVLYQYEACPFCNKVKGEFLVFPPSSDDTKERVKRERFPFY